MGKRNSSGREKKHKEQDNIKNVNRLGTDPSEIRIRGRNRSDRSRAKATRSLVRFGSRTGIGFQGRPVAAQDALVVDIRMEQRYMGNRFIKYVWRKIDTKKIDKKI